jgi:hypothetical protein
MLKKILFLFLFSLGGCSVYPETFDCPAHTGVGCVSLGEVNTLIEEKKLPLPNKNKEENNYFIPKNRKIFMRGDKGQCIQMYLPEKEALDD